MNPWISSYAAWICCLLGMSIAYVKGRRIILWGVLGYFLGPIGVIVLLCKATLPRKRYEWVVDIRERFFSRGIEKRFKELENADDFLREIDNDKKDEK